jgi:hypothetical protein
MSGGKRQGAGRPKNVNTKTLQVRGVPEEIHKFCGDWVREQIKIFKKSVKV